MGQHRAAVLPSEHGTSATATAYRGRRVAAVAPEEAPAQPPAPVALPEPAAYVGRRKAVVAAEAERLDFSPAEQARMEAILATLGTRDQSTSFDGEDTVILALGAAAEATEPAPVLVAGRRRAPRTGRRRQLAARLPSAPMVAGVAALAVAVVGVLATHEEPSPGIVTVASASQDRVAGLSVASGSSEQTKVGRGPQVSRDSSRDALGDLAKPKLVKAAEAQMRQRNAKLAGLAAQAQNYADQLKLNQWQLPVAGYHLTAGFGDVSGLWASVHTGLDFAAPSGTPITAIANGVITSTGYDGSYGNKTVLTLDDGTELWFCHQTSYAVSPGEEVRAGEVIGYVGSTGNVTGPHLHLEVRPGGGDPVDPMAALVAQGLNP